MKISLNWLTDYVDVSAYPAEKLGEVLTFLGLNCDSVTASDLDVVFDLDVTSNRPDWLGHLGVARELATALGLPFKQPDLSTVVEDGPAADSLTSVRVEAPDLCPRYTARLVRGIKVAPSPAWMVDRLAAAGIRSVNNVVDITNYVMLEYSQPLHAFDHARLDQGRIVVRRAKAGERIVSIDGTRCDLNERMLVIADAAKPVAIAGVMGGLESEISATTTSVLLESAQFDPMLIRQTARNLGIMTESSYRFERAVDPVGLERASLRACQLILQLCGGELAKGVVDAWAAPFTPGRVTMRAARCRAILGTPIADADQADILARLGLAPKLENGVIACTIPGYRGDLTREIDLIEEVARLHGFDKIPTRHKVTHEVTPPSPAQTLRKLVRDVLAGAGVDEAMTYTFVDDAEAELLGFAPTGRVDARVRRTNNLLRPTLLCSLLRACKTNQDLGNQDVSLYELAAVFPPKAAAAGDALPDEYTALGVVTQRPLQYLRGVLENLIQRVGREELDLRPAELPGFAAGCAAQIILGGREVGQIGLAGQAVLGYYGLEQPVAAMMLRFDALSRHAGLIRTYQPLPKFPPIRRDLSLVLDEAVTWQQVAAAVRACGQAELEGVDFVGIYRGKQVPPGKKSLTLSLTYRSAEGTLRHDLVDQRVASVLAELTHRLQATLRA